MPPSLPSLEVINPADGGEEREGRRAWLLPSFNSRNFLIYVWHEHEWILPVKVPAARVEAVENPSVQVDSTDSRRKGGT